MKKIKLLELFGGIGAPRKALENLGFDVKSIDYVEILNYAIEAYNNIYDLKYKSQSVLDWNMNVDVLVHGSPCQDFSVAGKNDLSTGRSILYMRTLEIIEKELNPRPKFVLWENVKGLINKRNFSHFQHYLDTLEKLGYKNYWKVLNAKDYGIPQSRERVFVISIRKDLPQTFNFDNLEKTEMKSLKSFLEPHENVPHDLYIRNDTPSMIKAIENGKVKVVDKNIYTITTKQMRWNNSGVIQIPLTTFNSENYVINPSNLNSHLKTVTATGALSRQKIAVEVDGVANPDDKKTIFLIEGKQYYLRLITPKEAWLLMDFKDEDYEKINHLPKTAKYQLAGNSIVVSVLEAIFKELLKGEN